MKKSFPSLIGFEVRQLLRDPWQLSLITWIPLLLCTVMWWIFSQGVATNIPVAVVDLDKSKVSRMLTRQYDASPSLLVEKNFLSVQAAEAELRSGKIYALIVIPADLEKNIIVGRPPQVTAFVNTQFLLVGKIVNAALLEAQSTFSTKLEVVKNMAVPTPVFDMALSTALPVGSQITPLFNQNKDYAQFLLAAIFPAMWQIIMVAACILSLAHEQRTQGLKQWLGDTPCNSVLAKMCLLGGMFWLQGVVFLAALYEGLKFPMHGDWSILLAAQLITVFASISISFLIYFLVKDAARALSMGAAYVAPGLAFMGVTFPVTDMTLPARIWRSLLPISHYVDIQFGQVNYGAPLSVAIPYFVSLSFFLCPLLLVFWLAKRMTSKTEAMTQEVSV